MSPEPKKTQPALAGNPLTRFFRRIAGIVKTWYEKLPPGPRRWIGALGAPFRRITLAGTLKLAARVAIVLFVLVIVGGMVVSWISSSRVPHAVPVSQLVYLDNQGWGADRESSYRETYYYSPQGANVKHLRYSWFVNLERAWSRERFAAPENLRSFRFLVDAAPTPANPDQLPVGFARFHDAEGGSDLLDITCAACHTGELHARNTAGELVGIRIDGGQARHAFTASKPGSFLPELMNSLTATYINPFKFRRFAMKVLGSAYPGGAWRLHGELREVLWAIVKQGVFIEGARGLYPIEEGFGRTDALGRISNNVFGLHLDNANLRTGNAPVSFPPVWDIWKFDWVQYNGSVRQPMARNMVETLGVGSDFRLLNNDGVPLDEQDRYGTSTMFASLVHIENALHDLKPPRWPEDVLGPIDCDRAREGKALFQKHCEGCHGPHNDNEMKAWQAPLKTKDDPQWVMDVLPLSAIGTDPNAATNFVNNRYDLSKTGISVKELREAMLPSLAEDELGYIRYLQAKAKKGVDPYKADCWSAYDAASKKAELDSRGPCLAALEKFAELKDPSTAAVCGGGGGLTILASPACDDAMRRYRKDVVELAGAAAHVCPDISKAIDGIDLSAVGMGPGLTYIGTLMRNRYYRQSGYARDIQDRLNGYGILDLPQVVLGYKARPLAGAWATAPYLHNGSVPTIYQMLSPASKRSDRFLIGNQPFDPVNVGLQMEPVSGDGFWFDTTVSGNSNKGHEFRAGYVEPCRIVNGKAQVSYQYGVIGPELTDKDRFAIIEYLKIRSDDPADTEFPSHCTVDLSGRKKL